jgi:hypothetical protein
VNGICCCVLPACCCQSAVAEGVIHVDLCSELSTHLALQALFTQSFPVCLCYKLSPFQALGKVTLHPLSQACVFIYSSRGKWFFSSLLWNFPPSATLTRFPTPGCWACAPAPSRASPALLACLFTVPGRLPFHQSSVLSVPHPLSHVSLLFLLFISQFLFFPQVEVSLFRGLCCSGPGFSVGVQQYCEAHLVCVFPSHLGVGDWWPGGPPCFSI